MTTFSDLKLSEKSLHALDRAGFEQPTPIQAQAIPPALAGKDVIGTAATGTGKTAAFLLPIIERLTGKTGTRALVLAPTRELALQIGEELERFGRGRHVRGAVIIGGVGMGLQTQAFKDRREVIIATPGRLLDHLQSGTARLDDVEVLVLDEADRMLDMGFKPQLTRILQRLPRARQTMLFSATMGGEVAEFAASHLRDPVRVEVARSGTTPARADQRVFLCSQEEKLPLLLALLSQDDLSTLVFTRTKRRADRVWKGVARAGHKTARIHANRTQGQRRQALEGFKDGDLPRAGRHRHRGPRHRRRRHRPRGELRPPPRRRGLRAPGRTHRPRRGQRARLRLLLARRRSPCSGTSRSSPGPSSPVPRCLATRRCSGPNRPARPRGAPTRESRPTGAREAADRAVARRQPGRAAAATDTGTTAAATPRPRCRGPKRRAARRATRPARPRWWVPGSRSAPGDEPA